MYKSDLKLRWQIAFTVYCFDIFLLFSSACMLLRHGPNYGSSYSQSAILLPVKACLSRLIKAFHILLTPAKPCQTLPQLCQSHSTNETTK